MGDVVKVESQGNVMIKKTGRNWEEVMNETRGLWKAHPAFVNMKDSIEITHWLRNNKA
jgi:hypothetical protein